jgi:hypothetical protein
MREADVNSGLGVTHTLVRPVVISDREEIINGDLINNKNCNIVDQWG